MRAAHSLCSDRCLTSLRQRFTVVVSWSTFIVAITLWPPTKMLAQASPQNEVKSPSLLVLYSGRVIEGGIQPAAGGYTVELPKGHMFVPYDQVRFEAQDLRDAYRKLRGSMPDLTANNHLALARWCMSQHQYNSARTELLDAMSLEPQRTDVRQMLKRLELITDPDSVYEAVITAPAADDSDFQAYEVKSLAGMSRELARNYTTRIQPLLLNKCGNAQCHGGRAPQQFKLLQRANGSRILAERNLASITQYIDSGTPQQSPLLTKPLGGQCSKRRAVFFGRSGHKQAADLRQFVLRYVRETGMDSLQSNAKLQHASHTARAMNSGQGLGPTSPKQLQGMHVAPTQRSGTAMASELQNGVLPPRQRPGNLSGPKEGQRLIREVLDSQRPDPFSPEAFNSRNSRLPAGQPARKEGGLK